MSLLMSPAVQMAGELAVQRVKHRPVCSKHCTNASTEDAFMNAECTSIALPWCDVMGLRYECDNISDVAKSAIT